MTEQAGHITGIGGVFFKSANQDELMAWYRDVLGIQMEAWGASFSWGVGTDQVGPGNTALNIFKGDSGYYPGPFMINFRVKELEAFLEKLRGAGVRVDDKFEKYDYGNFAWVYDPDGNKIELWEPIDAGF